MNANDGKAFDIVIEEGPKSQHQYSPYACLIDKDGVARASVRWSAGYSGKDTDELMRREALDRAQLFAASPLLLDALDQARILLLRFAHGDTPTQAEVMVTLTAASEAVRTAIKVIP